MTLDFVLLKDRNLALALRPGTEINSQACHDIFYVAIYPIMMC